MLEFSGANNPLYLVRHVSKGDKLTINVQGETKEIEVSLSLNDYNLFEVKGDKMPVAIHIIMDSFTTYQIQTEPGDTLYMFSDGFADQFGGKKGKKFMYKPFKKLILNNQGKPMQEQKQILDDAIEAWKAFEDPYTGESYEQIDDIVVVGVKIA